MKARTVKVHVIPRADEGTMAAMKRCAPRGSRSAKIVGGLPLDRDVVETEGFTVEYVLNGSKP